MREGSGGWNHAKLAYSVQEAAELLSLSRSALYRLIEEGDLATVSVGRSRRITYAQLEAFVRKLEQRQGFVRF